MKYGEVTIYDRCGRVIATSRNLRGILDRARKLQRQGTTTLVPISGMANVNAGAEGILMVIFPDQSFTFTRFVSNVVMRKWSKDRIIHGRGKFVLLLDTDL